MVSMTSQGGQPFKSFVVIDYDERGMVEIAREVLSELLLRAGAERVALNDRVM